MEQVQITERLVEIMAKYYVKMEELKTEGEEIQKYAKDVVDTKMQELIALADKLEWEGPTHEMFMELFNEKIKKIRYVAKMIEVYGKFMVYASEGFTDVNKKFAEDMQKIMEELKQQNEKIKNLQG